MNVFSNIIILRKRDVSLFVIYFKSIYVLSYFKQIVIQFIYLLYNHILKTFDLQSIDGLDLKKSILVQTDFTLNHLRSGFDIILPQINHNFFSIEENVR